MAAVSAFYEPCCPRPVASLLITEVVFLRFRTFFRVRKLEFSVVVQKKIDF